jgi:hypothetical protein
VKIDNQWQTTDAALALFGDNYSWDVAQEDATKLNNLDETLSFMLNGTALAIAKQSQPTDTDVLPMQINNLRHTNYQWAFDLENFQGATPFLWDEQTQSMTVITPTTVVPFTANDTQTDRFKIVFQAPLRIEDFGQDIVLYPNPGKSGGSFYLHGRTEAKVQLHNMLGQSIAVSTNAAGNTLQVMPSKALSAGIYIVSITQEGKTAQVKWIVE